MKTNKTIIYILTSAAVFVLLLAVASAAAFTNSVSAGTAAPVANSLPAKTALTSAAPMTSSVPHAGEDIRDIRQPRHLPTPWLWVVVAAGVAMSLCTWVFWRMLRQAPILEQSPQERAFERLEEARRFMNPEHAREYCFAVSQIIRGYVEEQLQLRAPRLTTEEFLRELVEGQDKIAGAQGALLGNFLEHCDLAKFAGWRYSLGDLSEMHTSAIKFVEQSSAAPATTPALDSAMVSRESAITNTNGNAI